MHLRLACLAMIGIMGLTGCGSEETTAAYVPTKPITVEEWKTLPIAIKYDPSTFDKLRQSDAKLRSKKAWDRFFRTVIVAERRKDLPTPGQKQ